MALKIDSLEVAIKTQADSASASIDNLNKALGKIARKASRLKDVANAMEKVKASVGDVGSGGGSKGGSKGGGTKGGLLAALAKGGGSFLKSIGRIALYRGIRSALKAVTTAIKEGTANLYQYSKMMGGSFAANLDKVSTSLLYLKNGLAVGLAPVIEWLTPMVVTLADAFAEIGNAISEVSADSKGEKYFTRAKKTFKEFAEAANKAKSAVLGFDELNVIQSDNNYADMFEEVEVNSERAENNFVKIHSAIAAIAGIGIGTGALKVLSTLASAKVVEIGIGDILLKAGGITLGVAGTFNFAQLLKKSIEDGKLDSSGQLGIAASSAVGGLGWSLVMKNPIPLMIGLAISTAALETQAHDVIKEWFGIDLDQIAGEIKFVVTNIGVFIVNTLKGVWNVAMRILDTIINGPLEMINGIIDLQNQAFPDSKWNKIEYAQMPYEEYTDFTSLDQAIAWARDDRLWRTNGTGRQTGGEVSSGEPGLDENQYWYGPQMGSSEPIQIYLDGKQIYGAVRKAELVSGSRVARGILAE